jgi:hypothetical protein
MKKVNFVRIIIIICLTFLFVNPAKAELVDLATDLAGNTYSMDSNSVTSNNGFIEASMNLNFSTVNNGVIFIGSRQRFNCSSRSVMSLEATSYDMNGKPIVSSRESTPWTQVTAGSIGENIYLYVCNR